MNDNRTQILAQQAIEDANNSSYQQQQMEQHREMILAQQQNIRRLKAELVDMTMQRDAWFKMASTYALEQAPELETVEDTPEAGHGRLWEQAKRMSPQGADDESISRLQAALIRQRKRG